jgi:hypothetical protein
MREYSFFVDKNGVIPEYARKQCATEIAKRPEKHIKIKIWEAEETPSDRQRKYYFAVVVHKYCQHFINNESGKYSKEEKDAMHNSLMRTIGGFNKPFVNVITGEEDEGRLSWNDLSKTQAEGYMTLCRKRAAEKGFNVPEPHEDEAIWLMDNYY